MDAEKKVVDVACGGRMFYFDKNDPSVLFCDNRLEQRMDEYKRERELT